MDLKAISELLAQFDQSSLTELEINNQKTKIYFSKHDTPVVSEVTQYQVTGNHPETNDIKVNDFASVESDIIAPIVGTVYLQPTPDRPAFKQVGDQVSVGETVALIEAMKMMTEIKSPVNGVLTNINVQPEQIVEYGQILFKVRPLDK